MHSQMQKTLVDVLCKIIRPIVTLYLRCGVGYSEFQAVVRGVYISVAAEEYGIRGRPTNTSRIAAMTGISRKEIKRIRDQLAESRWTPAMEVSPANLLIHFWHFDSDFSDPGGVPLALPIEGPSSFTELAQRYAGDIPVGALKEELKRAGVIVESGGMLVVKKRYFQTFSFDDDFIQNMAFSLQSLAGTIVHNSELICRTDYSQELNETEGRLERFAWSEQMSDRARMEFRNWVRSEGSLFIEKADEWIGKNELELTAWDKANPKSIGVGIYFFEED